MGYLQDNKLQISFLSAKDTQTIEAITALSQKQNTLRWKKEDLVDFISNVPHDKYILVAKTPKGQLAGFLAYEEYNEDNAYDIWNLQVDKTLSRTLFPAACLDAEIPVVQPPAQKKSIGLHLLEQWKQLLPDQPAISFNHIHNDSEINELLHNFTSTMNAELAPDSGWQPSRGSDFYASLEDQPEKKPRRKNALSPKKIAEARAKLTSATGVEWQIVEKRGDEWVPLDRYDQCENRQNVFLSTIGPMRNPYRTYRELRGELDISEGYPEREMTKSNTPGQVRIPISWVDNVLDAKGLKPEGSLLPIFKSSDRDISLDKMPDPSRFR